MENALLPTGPSGGPCTILRGPKCRPQLTCPVLGRAAPAGRARAPGARAGYTDAGTQGLRGAAGRLGALLLCQGVWPREPELCGDSQGSVCLGFYRSVCTVAA